MAGHHEPVAGVIALPAGDRDPRQRRPVVQEPRRIVLLCYVLSMSVLMLGELNAVAPFITMWFLTCYSIINGAWRNWTGR